MLHPVRIAVLCLYGDGVGRGEAKGSNQNIHSAEVVTSLHITLAYYFNLGTNVLRAVSACFSILA